MCCRPWVQKLHYVFLYKPILSEKNSSSSAALCDPWVISSQLELSVVCGVIFLSGVTATTFLLAFKNRKMHGFGEINSSFSTLNDCRVVCINRMGQQICIICFARRWKKWLTLREWSRRFRSASILYCLRKKNPIIELYYNISLAYIVCFRVNMSFSSTRGFNLEKCMHSIDADINACP